MTNPKNKKTNQKYTCNEYREEMILAGLQRSLQNPDLTPEERARIEKEIAILEESMGL
jgi:lipoprotein NlpI